MKKRNNNEWKKRRYREAVLSCTLPITGYVPTKSAISKSYYKTHWLRRYGTLPGTEAYEEVIRFIATQKERYPISSKGFDWYDVSLKMALNRVKGRRFINANGETAVISSVEDVHQVIREMMRAAGISGEMSSVKEFVLTNS